MTQITVSIVIRTMGERVSLLAECLESLAEQVARQFEVVVVEDGSDLCKDLVQKFSEQNQIPCQYKSISKSGRCIAGNTGMAMAEGSWLNFLDDDDGFYPNHIDVMLQAAGENSDVDGLVAYAHEIPTDFNSFSPLDYEEGAPVIYSNIPRTRIELFARNFPIQSCMFKKSLFEEKGGFDEELDKLEDWFLWQSYFSDSNIIFLDDVTSYFRVPMDNASFAERKEMLLEYAYLLEEKIKTLDVVCSAYDMYQLYKKLKTAEHRSEILQRTVSYRVGRLITMLPRTIFDIIKGEDKI